MDIASDTENMSSRAGWLGVVESSVEAWSSFVSEQSKALFQIWKSMLPKEVGELGGDHSETEKALTSLSEQWFKTYNDFIKAWTSFLPPSLKWPYEAWRPFELWRFFPGTNIPTLLPKELPEYVFKANEAYEKLAWSWLKYGEIFYTTWNKAFERLSQKARKHVASPEMALPTTVKEFYNFWVEIFTEEYDKALKSPEFISAQSTMVSDLMDFTKYGTGAIEMMVSSMPASPLAVRSEIDDVYKELHSMKRDIRGLSKSDREAKELSQSELGNIHKELDSLKRDIRGLRKKVTQKGKVVEKTGVKEG
jgi:hypothetical protein